jgi:hypothetical protein
MRRSLELARAVFKFVIEEKPAARFMIRSRTRVVKRHLDREVIKPTQRRKLVVN